MMTQKNNKTSRASKNWEEWPMAETWRCQLVTARRRTAPGWGSLPGVLLVTQRATGRRPHVTATPSAFPEKQWQSNLHVFHHLFLTHTLKANSSWLVFPFYPPLLASDVGPSSQGRLFGIFLHCQVEKKETSDYNQMGDRGKLAWFQCTLVNLLPRSKVLQAGCPGSCTCWETGCFLSWTDWESLRRRWTSEQELARSCALSQSPPIAGLERRSILYAGEQKTAMVSLLIMSVENQPLVRTNLSLLKDE